MKTTLIAGCVAALLSQASAHYIFEYFTYGGVKYPAYQYIRPNTDYNSPVILLNSTDLRCNVGGLLGTGTQTLSVVAGQSFSFTSDTPVYHNGPLSIYMAKAPGDASSFDGSGQVWFKILDLGPTFDASGTATWPLAQTYTYTIPPALPNGNYLIRIQQIGIHNPYPGGTPQFYVECAQVSVTGGGSGTPGPLVSIPGFIDGTEPGYTVNIYTNFHNYTIPGPAVWAGQSAGGGGSPPPTTMVTSTKTTSTAAPPPTTSSKPLTTTSTTSVKTSTSTSTSSKTSSTAPAQTGSCTPTALYGQCGGMAGVCPQCAQGTCVFVNQYYSQCK